MDKLKGEVRVLNVKRGFGFIAGSDRRDFFFHFSKVPSNHNGFKLVIKLPLTLLKMKT
jgi:cold shock CspA family protein